MKNYNKMTKAQLIKEVEDNKKEQNTVISNCMLETTIEIACEQTVENVSKALLNLTELFKNQKVEVTGISVASDKTEFIKTGVTND